MTPDHPSDPPRQHVDLARGPAAYTDVGEGPVVLLVHGLPGSARDYRWLGAALETRLRVIRVDMPGFGETPLATAPSASVEGRADFLAELVGAIGLDRPVVFGHSMAGPVVTDLAVRHPDVVRALGLLAAVAHRPHRLVRQYPRRAISWALRMPGMAGLLASPLEQAYVRTGFRGSTHEQRVHTTHCVAAVSFPRHAANLAALRLPTLVAWTDDDPLVEREISEELYWRVPSGPRIRFADGGHNLQKSRAIELSEAIVAWCGHLWLDPDEAG